MRIHLLQQFFGHSDPSMEEALHDIPLYQEFAHLDAGMTRLPDESTILRFRHMLQAHGLGQQILATVNAKLIDRGLMLKTGTVVDATLIAAPSSTKNDKGDSVALATSLPATVTSVTLSKTGGEMLLNLAGGMGSVKLSQIQTIGT